MQRKKISAATIHTPKNLDGAPLAQTVTVGVGTRGFETKQCGKFDSKQ